MIENVITAISEYGFVAKMLLIVLITVIVDVASRLIVRKMAALAQKNRTGWDDALIEAIGPPAYWLIWVVGLTVAFQISGMMSDDVIDMLNIARILVVIVLFAWFLFRLTEEFGRNLVGKATLSGGIIDQSSVDITSKLIKITVVILALLVSMQTLGFSLTGLLAFGGIGGIAIGFAAQDMLANFFGGLMLYFDRPFKVGDWIRSPDREIEGIVENIGWRMTLIRNFDSRPLYVPNSSFSNITIENVTRMNSRRIYEIVGIRYQDAGAMNQIVDDVRAYLKSHEDIDQDKTVMVGFTTFSPSSLDFFVYCFTQTQAGPEYYKVKQEILLRILEIVEGHGAFCAFPTTTLNIPNPVSMTPSKETG